MSFSLVGETTSTFTGSSGTITFTVSNPNDTLILSAAETGSAQPNISGITDTQGNTWQQGPNGDVISGSTYYGVDLWFVQPSAAGSLTLTIDLLNSATFHGNLAEWAGIDPVLGYFGNDNGAVDTGTGTAITSGPCAQDASKELFIGVGITAASTIGSPTSPFSPLTLGGSPGNAGASYYIAPDASSYAAEWTGNASEPWIAIAANFYPVGVATLGVLVQIGSHNPYSTNPEWTEITDQVQTASIKWGRQHELQQFEPGTVSLLVDDRAGWFEPWSWTSPFCNQLPFDDTVFDGTYLGNLFTGPSSVNDWTASEDLIATGGGGIDGFAALVVISSGSGGSATCGVEVTAKAGIQYNGFAQVGQTASESATGSVTIAFYNASHTLLASHTGTAVSLSFGTYSKVTVSATAPANTAYVKLSVNYSGADPYLVSQPGITETGVDPNTGVILQVLGWSPGLYAVTDDQYVGGLTPGRSVQVFGTISSAPYVVGGAYLENVVPAIKDELNKDQAINAADALKLITNSVLDFSLYPGLVISNDPFLYWRLGDPAGSTMFADASHEGNLAIAPSAAPVAGSTPLLSGDATTSCYFTSGDQVTWWAQAGFSSYLLPSSVYVSGWLRVPPNTTDTGPLIDLSSPASSGKGGPIIGVNNSGQAECDWKNATSSFLIGASTKLVNDGEAHFVAVTVDTSAGTATFWCDAEQVATTTLPSSFDTACNVRLNGPSSGWAQIQDFSILPAAYYEPLPDTMYQYGTGIGTIELDAGTYTEYLLLGNGIPATSLDIETGVTALLPPQATVGSSTVFDLINQVMASEQGAFFQTPDFVIHFWNRDHLMSATRSIDVQATFANNGVNLPYVAESFQPARDDLDLWNEVPTQVNPAKTSTPTTPLYVTQNPQSIEIFGRRSLQGYTNLLYVDESQAVYLGQFLVLLYSWPITRSRSFKVTSPSDNGSGTLWVTMFSLVFGDLVSVSYAPPDPGQTFVETAQVEQITHTIVPGILWTTQYQLNPYAFAAGPWFIFGDPTYGTLDGPGLLAF